MFLFLPVKARGPWNLTDLVPALVTLVSLSLAFTVNLVAAKISLNLSKASSVVGGWVLVPTLCHDLLGVTTGGLIGGLLGELAAILW